jgi:hypothetical protein
MIKIVVRIQGFPRLRGAWSAGSVRELPLAEAHAASRVEISVEGNSASDGQTLPEP